MLIQFIKYVISAGSSFILDLTLFSIFSNQMQGILGQKSIIFATVVARIISSLYNYFFNSRLVYQKWDKNSIYKYYFLVIIQMMVSALGTYFTTKIIFTINKITIKAIIDMAIFIINYVVQKKIVFKN